MHEREFIRNQVALYRVFLSDRRKMSRTCPGENLALPMRLPISQRAALFAVAEVVFDPVLPRPELEQRRQK